MFLPCTPHFAVVEFARFRSRSLEQFFRGYAMRIIGRVPRNFGRNQIDSNEQNGSDWRNPHETGVWVIFPLIHPAWVKSNGIIGMNGISGKPWHELNMNLKRPRMSRRSCCSGFRDVLSMWVRKRFRVRYDCGKFSWNFEPKLWTYRHAVVLNVWIRI